VSMPNCVRTRAIVCIRVGWRSKIGVGVGIGIGIEGQKMGFGHGRFRQKGTRPRKALLDRIVAMLMKLRATRLHRA
jgi:hypothetical protein